MCTWHKKKPTKKMKQEKTINREESRQGTDEKKIVNKD